MVGGVSGPGWGCCFTSIKVWTSLTNSLRKSKKTAKKLLFLAHGGPLTEDGLEYSNFEAVFLDFLKDFVSDEQTFIGVKQHPQDGPEKTHIMCVKYENFLKNRFFDFFWTNSYAPPHRRIIVLRRP